MAGEPTVFVNCDSIDEEGVAALTKHLHNEVSRRGFLGTTAGLALTGLLGHAADAGATVSRKKRLPGSGKKIGIALNIVNNFTINLVSGVGKVAAAGGYGVIGYTANFNPAAEPNSFNKLIQQGVAGIVVLPVTPNSAARGILAAQQAKVPVVNLGWASPSAVDHVYVGRVSLNNINGAKLVAGWLKKNAKPGEILVIEGQRGNETSDQILKGLTLGVQSLGSPWRIVGSAEGGYTRDGAIKGIEALSVAHPNAKIVVDFAAEMGAGIASWRQRNNRRDFVSITSDGNVEMKGLMKQGWITADRYYSSGESGLIGAQLLRDYIELGNKSGGVTEVHTLMADKKNIDAVETRYPLLYPKYTQLAKSIS